jgi:uncharacterized protein (TIGR02246 family)
MEAPETVVAEQVNAYNKHDLQRFVNTYADDVDVVGRDGQVIHGHAGLRQTYGTCSSTVLFAPRDWVASPAANVSSTMNGPCE